VIGANLNGGVKALADASVWMGANFMKDPRLPAASAVPFLMLAGYAAGGWQMARAAQTARAALAAGKGDAAFYKGKLATARFYAENILPKATALFASVRGAESVLALEDAQF
jgi:3-(methylthio)propanoyl-CoA dehydrogenase